jgi:hypothetical protein
MEIDQAWEDDGIVQIQLFCIGWSWNGVIRSYMGDAIVVNEHRAVYDRRSVDRVDGSGKADDAQRLIRPEMPKWN